MEDSAQRLSYKFQRLRERLRDAIATGELVGKLPGERLLAQRFQVNAKTLSKALTDLAAEGLLDRTIGRGTFVRAVVGGSDAPLPRPMGRWLMLCKPDCDGDPVCLALNAINPDNESIVDAADMRPSLINQFSAVIDVHGSLPDAALRDLLLRSRRLVRVDTSPRTFSTHAVMIDRAAAIGLQVRDLVRNGITRLVIVDDASSEAFEIARAVARRLEVGTVVVAAKLDELPGIDGVGPDVAFIGGSPAIAAIVRQRLAEAGVGAPEHVSVACVGIVDDAAADVCSGYTVTAVQVAQTVAQILDEPQLNRPTSLWLVGAYLDRGTVRGDAFVAREAERKINQ